MITRVSPSKESGVNRLIPDIARRDAPLAGLTRFEEAGILKSRHSLTNEWGK
jgi:hypothetical protein